jgi:hypothetical protein
LILADESGPQQGKLPEGHAIIARHFNAWWQAIEIRKIPKVTAEIVREKFLDNALASRFSG